MYDSTANKNWQFRVFFSPRASHTHTSLSCAPSHRAQPPLPPKAIPPHAMYLEPRLDSLGSRGSRSRRSTTRMCGGGLDTDSPPAVRAGQARETQAPAGASPRLATRRARHPLPRSHAAHLVHHAISPHGGLTMPCHAQPPSYAGHHDRPTHPSPFSCCVGRVPAGGALCRARCLARVWRTPC